MERAPQKNSLQAYISGRWGSEEGQRPYEGGRAFSEEESQRHPPHLVTLNRRSKRGPRGWLPDLPQQAHILITATPTTPQTPSLASSLSHPAQPRVAPSPPSRYHRRPSARQPPRRMRGPLGACAVRSEAGAAAFGGLRARGGSASLQRGRAAEGTRPGRGHPAPSSAVGIREGESRPRPAAPSPSWPARSSRRRGGRTGKLRYPSRTRNWRWPASTCCSTTASANPTSSSRSTGEPPGASPQRRPPRSCPGLGAAALPALGLSERGWGAGWGCRSRASLLNN